MDGTTAETCDACGFDAGDWRVRDAVTVLDALGLWWRLATSGMPVAALVDRPAPGTWSVLEHARHTTSVLAAVRQALEPVLTTDAARPPAAAREGGGTGDGAAPAALDADGVVAGIATEGRALAALASGADDGQLDRPARLSGATLPARAALLHAVHAATHAQMDVGRVLAASSGTGPTGRVVQISASDGGVPKVAVRSGAIGRRGLAGDRQRDAKHHGRPFQALCLWSSEVIAGLVAEGHPIGPGAAGENLTIEGLDWEQLRPGTRLRIGSALAELSLPAVPCAKQARWFTDGDVSRLAHEVRPGGVRWYAWVREAGEVVPGDEVVLHAG